MAGGIVLKAMLAEAWHPTQTESSAIPEEIETALASTML
jgi:hypothetical protein